MQEDTQIVYRKLEEQNVTRYTYKTVAENVLFYEEKNSIFGNH